MSGSSTFTLMAEIKITVRKNAENNQIDEVSNETTLDSHQVPVNSNSNTEETSSTRITHVTVVAPKFFGTQYGFGLN